MSTRILVLGSINTDLVIRGPRLPQPGETVIGGTFYSAHGGKGANQAVAAARAARCPVALVGAVGDDDFGRQSLEHFAQERLDCEHVLVKPGVASGVALILVSADGENLISVASGANAMLSPDDVAALPEGLFASPGVFLTCLELPIETVAAGLQRARQNGLTTILNPAPADPRAADANLLSLVDILTPNEGEALQLAGVSGEAGEEKLNRAADRLLGKGVGQCAITRGRKGCALFGRETASVPACRVTPVDTTAAGDALNGALAAALAEGMPIIDALRFASRAAAISVTRAGAQPSLPARAEIDSSLL